MSAMIKCLQDGGVVPDENVLQDEGTLKMDKVLQDG